jgi:hypothetical protein
MNREKILKKKTTNNIKNNKMSHINISKMNVENFFKSIEMDNDNQAFYRHINITYNEKGKKIPKGEKNDFSIEDIKKNRGNASYNTLSLSVKHIPNLYVVDYDTHIVDCEFYELLNNDNVAFTNTKKGSHYYIKINNIDTYKNQQKIHINPKIDVDLIKTNNIWETKDRTITGTIKEYDWNDIKKYFDCNKMNFENSPPSSPPPSPKSKEDEIIFEPIENAYDAGELQSIINILPNECYEYELWIRIGMAICNITNGDNIGKGMYIDWSKKDKENYDFNVINVNWKTWIKRTGNKVGMTFLRKLKSKYQPKKNKTLKEIFFEDINCEKNYKEAKESMLKELNNRLIFIRSSGEYIILDKKIITKYQRDDITIDEQFNIPSWYCKNATKTKDHFLNEKFSYTFDVSNEDGDKKTIKIDPFKMWCEWEGKRNVFEIGFDPRNRKNDDIFNLWNGYNIGKEDTEKYDEAEAKPLLDHIKNIWCKGSEESYEYIMNYFAHILQKPYEKTGVVLALKSEQGGGKGIVLKKLGNIIGDTHYAQNSNANFLFGDFNGQLEGKILINLDEAFWGGDKKMEGVIKNKVTETKQTINKKNKENYVIDCHANYIITTNNDWFAGTTEDDRRHYCLELDNAKAGRTTKESEKYFSEIENVSCESFAKILYNRDISNFKARMFKKTKLLQDQVERNWNSPKVWWNSVMKKGGFQYGEHFIEWNEVLQVEEGDYNIINYGLKIKNKKKEKKVVYEKEWLFSCYDKQTYNSRKFDNSSFWREMEKHCICDLYQENRIQINKQRRMFIFLPSLEDARKKWNEKQQYDYNYDVDEEDEWDVDDCDIDSSDDE